MVDYSNDIKTVSISLGGFFLTYLESMKPILSFIIALLTIFYLVARLRLTVLNIAEAKKIKQELVEIKEEIKTENKRKNE